jgi:hypothetical protein
VAIFTVPKVVFVPFEWNSSKGHWEARQDLPRFRHPEEAAAFFQTHPEVCYKDGQPRVTLHWQERDEPLFIQEFLKGVGTESWTQTVDEIKRH